MADLPDQLVLERHRDPSGVELAARWIVLGLIAAFAVAALLGVFGQQPSTSSATAQAAELEVSAPTRLRGGLFFQGRFAVTARSNLENATLVLASGWVDNVSVNTIEPAPVEETGRDGEIALSFGPLPAGEELVVYMQFQVNPTNVGRHDASVALTDGQTPIATDDRTLIVFP